MRSTFLNASNEQMKKTTSSHFKRYSQYDLKTDSINSLLLTQSNAFSNLKFKPLKTKLPHISLTTSTQNTTHSHSKINRILESAFQMINELQGMTTDIENLKLNVSQQRNNIQDKYQKSNSILGSKVQRLSKMVEYTIGESKQRSAKIGQQYERINSINEHLKQKLSHAREKIKFIEDSMGIYTGQDKYLF